MEKKRDVYYDVLRGIAILMVIAIHAYPQDATSLELFVRQSLNCAVPIFLAVSGYFVGQIKFENEGVYLSFIKKQLIRVYIPMLIWSLPWLVLNIRNGQGIGTQFLMTLLGGMSIFYFIPLIIQCYILTPVLKNINKLGGGGKFSNYYYRYYDFYVHPTYSLYERAYSIFWIPILFMADFLYFRNNESTK